MITSIAYHPWNHPKEFEVEIDRLKDQIHVLRFTKDGSGKVFATREQLVELHTKLGVYLFPEPSHD